MARTSRRVDPILLAVLTHRLDSVTQEMGQTMIRTSRSPIFSEARDCCTAIYDGQARLVAQASYIPVMVGATPWAMRAIVERFGDDMKPGDVFITNDPFKGGNNHLPDVTIVKPVFFEGRPRFFTLAKGHHASIGGGGVSGYNPKAASAWEEGLRIPPLKLYEEGKAVTSLWELMLLNVKIPFLLEGDLHCQVGAATIGERALVDLLQEYGAATIEEAVDALLDSTEQQMRAEIARIPDGVYHAERHIDHDGFDLSKLYSVRLALRIEGDSATFDFGESDAQARGFINSSYANTYSSCFLALSTAVDREVRRNEGAMRPINVVAPKGSVVNATEPSPTTECTTTSAETIIEACWQALSQAVGKQTHAAWGRWCGPATTGFNPFTGRPFVAIEFMARGGGGATEGYDGWDHVTPVVTLGGVRSTDPELHELVTPYRVLQYELMEDAAGAGEWRGGLGVSYKILVEADNITAVIYGSGTRDETAPFGLNGGGSAPRNVLTLYRANGEKEILETNSFYTFHKGDVVEVLSSGGGGYGPPFRRLPERVGDDVRNGVVSAEAARAVYGVAVNADGSIDRGETERLRARTEGR